MNIEARRARHDEARISQKLNFELTARRLLATNIPEALRCATDIRERIEIVHTSEYGNFLRHLFPAFRSILLRTPAAPDREVDTRFRHVVLEILNRLPNNEVLRPYAPDLLRIATETLSRDTEENALTCLRIIFDLHKNFRPALESEVQRFLDLVQRIYRLLPTSINKAFSISLQSSLLTQQRLAAKPALSSDTVLRTSLFHRPSPSVSSEAHSNLLAPTSAFNPATRMIPERGTVLEAATLPETRSVPLSTVSCALQGLYSFKVLTECPLIVMLLFQLYPKYIQENIPLLTPLMMSGLALRAPTAAYRLQRDRYREFVACQVKALSFLTYLLRGFSELMKPHEETISTAVIALMMACPGDAVSIRKELLVATRHILATEFRRGFYHHIDTLLNENVLIGGGRPGQETLRPLAFSTLADLVHHVRAQLDISQLSRVVMLFSRNLHDPALPLTVQTTSVRLLLNLVDFIFHNSASEKARGRRLLVHILEAMVAKFDTLRFYMLNLDSSSQSANCNVIRNGRPSCAESLCIVVSRSDTMRRLVLSAPTDCIGDVRLLIQTLIRGLKTVIWCISHYHHEKSSTTHKSKMEPANEDGRHRRHTRADLVSELPPSEAETVGLFFYWGLLCCRVAVMGGKFKRNHLKEILDNFAAAFTVLERSDIICTVGPHIPKLFDAMLGTPSLLAIAQTLLANSNVSATFADILVSFLMERLSDLSSFEQSDRTSSSTMSHGPSYAMVGTATSRDIALTAAKILPAHRASTLLRLFRIILGSVALFPQNERVLRGRLRTLVRLCLQHAVASDQPVAYYFLLRSIFRSVSSCGTPVVLGAKAIQTELGEISAFALDSLIQQRMHVEKSTLLYFVLTELCITVPMALASAIPFLPRLLPLLCDAVRATSSDLPSLGLRTLEYYLDHLGPSRLFSLLKNQPHLHVSMMLGVSTHLRPAPYALGTIALRILGKLGGQNRHFLELVGGLIPSSCPSRSCPRSLLTEKSPESSFQQHNSVDIILRWRGPSLDWPDRSGARLSGVTTQSMSFAFDINPCLTSVCELFHSLMKISGEHAGGDVSRPIDVHILHRYQTVCFRLLSSVLCSIFELPSWPRFPKNCLDLKLSIANRSLENEVFSVARRYSTQLCRLLQLVVCAAAHARLEEEATPLLQSLSFIFAILLYCAYNCQNTLGSIELDGKQSLYAFTSTVLEAATDHNGGRVVSTAYGALKHHMGCIYFLEMQTLEPASKPRSFVVTDLLSRICLSLRKWDLFSCRRVCQMLSQLLNTFGHAWARPNKHLLANALMDTLAYFDLSVILLSETGIVHALHSILQTPCTGHEVQRFVHLFARNLSNVNPAVRLAAQSGISELNRLAGLSQMSSKFLKQLAPNLMHVLISCHLNSFAARDDAIGALDALNYIMSLKPPLILPDVVLQNWLLKSVRMCNAPSCKCTGVFPRVTIHGLGWGSQGARFCKSLDLFFLCHSPSVSLTSSDHFLAATLRAIHAMIRTSKLIASNTAKGYSCLNPCVRSREVLLQYVPLGTLREILHLVLLSITDFSSDVVLFSSSVLLQEILALGESSLIGDCETQLNSFLNQASLNLKTTTIQYLDGLGVLTALPVLRCIHSYELVDSFLSCLRDILNHEEITVTSPQAVDHPLEVATKVLLLISHLSCRRLEKNLSLLELVVTTLFKLEETCFLGHNSDIGTLRTGLSHFRAAVAKFLFSHPSATVRYFFHASILGNSRYISFLNGLLSLQESANFLFHLISMEAIQLLMNSAFTTPQLSIEQLSLTRAHATCMYSTLTMTNVCVLSRDNQHGGALSIAAYTNPTYRTLSSSRKPAEHHGLLTLISLLQADPYLFGRYRKLGMIILALWRAHRRQADTKVTEDVPNEHTLRQQRDFFLMTQGLIGYCRSFPSDVHVLFDMLFAFMCPSPIDFTFLKNFYRHEVAQAWRSRYKRGAILFFLRLLTETCIAMELMVLALRLILTPMLISTFESRKNDSSEGSWSDRVISPGSLNLFVRCALDTSNRKMQMYSEAFRVELLKLTTVLIEHLGHELVEHRKDLIKFAWNHLKSEDSLSKQWAYVNVCRFVATYETPPKIILQVYVALLRTFQPEARELVKVALDVLMPALPKRLPTADFVKAIKWTKKIMYEEGHALAQLVHMWQLVVRHPTLFFPYRSQFMPQMVNSLNRLGLPPNCPVENRQLAVALADLILNWEYRKPAHDQHNTRTFTSALPQADDDLHLTMTMIEMVANFLVRLALFASDNKEVAVQQLVPHCLFLFTTTLRAWPNAYIRFSYFEKIIATSSARLELTLSKDPPYSPALLVTCLEIMCATMSTGRRPNAFLIDNLSKAQLLICPCFFMRNIEIQSKLQKLMTRLTELYPPNHSCSPTISFHQRVKYVIESCLCSAMTSRRSGTKQRDWAATSQIISHVLPVIRLIDAIHKYAPVYVYNHGHNLIRVGQILVFQHLDSIRRSKDICKNVCYATPILSALAQAAKSACSSLDSHANVRQSSVANDIIDAICLIFSLLAQSLFDSSLIDIRRELVVLMFICLERSDSPQIALALSKLICSWLAMDKPPLRKAEKVAFVEHMLDLDGVTETALQPLCSRGLCTLSRQDGGLKVATKPSQRNHSLAALLTPHPGMRAAFRGVFVRNFAHSISHQIIMMLDVNWSPVSNRFWLVILIELVLDGLDVSGPLRLSSGSVKMPDLPRARRELTRMIAHVDVTLQRQYTVARSCLLAKRESLKHFIEPLKEVIHAHIGLAEEIWVHLLPCVCFSVESHQQRSWQILLANSILRKFSKPQFQAKLQIPTMFSVGQVHQTDKDTAPYTEGHPHIDSKHSRLIPHQQAFSQGPCLFGPARAVCTRLNVPRALMQVCTTMLPRCLATRERAGVSLRNLLVVAARHDCHHAALHLIEQVNVAQQNIASQCSSSSEAFEMQCVSLLHSLRDSDIQDGLLAKICKHPMSSVAFSLRCYGFLTRAQDTFLCNMVSELSQGDPPESRKTSFETDIWCSAWLECARDLSQWSVLQELITCASGPLPKKLLGPVLRLQAHWKSRSWDNVRKYFKAGGRNYGSNNMSTTPQIKLIETRLAIVDGVYDDVEELCGECIQLALNSWTRLPRPRLGIASHDRLLHLFHELIEVHESNQLLHEAIQHSRAQTYPDLRTIAHTWRHRLPSEWNSMSDWDDIMLWRQHIYLSIQRAFSWGVAAKVYQLHDAPWTVATLGRIARKQELVREDPHHHSTRDQDDNMDQNDAFCKLRERILAYRNLGDLESAYARTGLYLIDSTKMSVLDKKHHSEIYRLKGAFLGTLGRYREAHCAFSSATKACSTYGRAWYSWAVLCDLNCSTEPASEMMNRLAKNSLLCYVAAIECGYARAFVCGIARVLCLLQLAKENDELQSYFFASSDIIPPGAWIPWIPQILRMLHDLPGVKHVLVSLSESTPQAIFYSIKTEMACHNISKLSRRLLNQVFDSVYMNHVSLSAEMATLAEEMIMSSQPASSEVLLHMLHSVQKACNGSSHGQIYTLLYTLLHKISSQYAGRGDVESAGGPSWGTYPSQGMLNFIERNASLQQIGPEVSKVISGHLDSLSHILVAHTSDIATLITPIHVYPRLQYTRQCGVKSTASDPLLLEVPGQYSYTFGASRPELHLPLMHIERCGTVRIRNGRSLHRFAFLADEGQARILSSSISSLKNAHTNDRVSQLLGVVDFALVQSRVAQTRRLRVAPLMSITFGPNLRLTEDRWSWLTLCEVNQARQVDLSCGKVPLASYANAHIREILLRVCSSGKHLLAPMHDVRRAVYNEICASKISAELLSRHMHAILEGFEAAWTFRRTYATQLAIPSTIGFILAAEVPRPEETMICQRTGRACVGDFNPELLLAQGEPPSVSAFFRLTRNIERLLQPFLLQSIFKSTVGSILLALRSALQPGELLDPYIDLYLSSEVASKSREKIKVDRADVAEARQSVINRVTTVAPPLRVNDDDQVDAGLTKLTRLAQCPDYIALMDARWQPWV